jgi:hypothetical protein
MGGEKMMIEASAIANIGQGILMRVRLRIQRRMLWLQSLGEGDRLMVLPQVMIAAESKFYQVDLAAQELNSQIESADTWLAEHSTWQRLRQIFELSAEESDLLSLAIALEIDPLLHRVYAYLHENTNMDYATPWLASILFNGREWRFGCNSALVQWRLAYPLEDNRQSRSITAQWIADPDIIDQLITGKKIDPTLATAIKFIEPPSFCFYPAQLTAIQTFLETMAQERLEIELVAVEGVGKRTFASQICARLGWDLIAVDVSLLFNSEISPDLATDLLMRVIRLARWQNAIIYWYNCEEIKPNLWQTVQKFCPLTFLGTKAPLKSGWQQAIRKTFNLPDLTRVQRIHFWQQITDNYPLPDAIANWVMTPAEITAVARVIPAGKAAIVETCQQMVRRQPGELFTPLICPYTWADLVLPGSIQQHLEELESQAKLRSQVYEDWGFERLHPLGKGLTVLFAGSSGTGKTMAAQVLARSLGMELYRVDLAGVVNKYIGETEKRLKQVFDACERSNVLLFFDEADALFGQRTQVKDAHDRFANIEIDYLLQRMEQFDGIAILATNRKGDLDRAFLRRLRFIVDFVQPGIEERLKLWKLALLERSPRGEELLGEIDWQFLADRLNMTGADIKGAALGAAFLAKSQESKIKMGHILQAAKREMTKQGITLSQLEWQPQDNFK